MSNKSHARIDHQRLELDGIRYVILRETVFEMLCQKACVGEQTPPSESPATPGLDLDRVTLAEKLVRRRQVAGLSQAELARSAGIRPETLNRIERGRTTPDFATVRKLVVAMDAAEKDRAALSISQPPKKGE
jgi:DNA-binding XRE family transcriptional regulator